MTPEKIRMRSPYDGRQDEDSGAAVIICLEPMTVQSDAQNADLNFLLRDFRGGIVPVIGSDPNCFYGDVSEVGDYQACLETVLMAGEAFMKQPAHIRDKFDNNPGKFIDWCTDPKNADEAVALGLREAPVKTEVSPPAA